ncbi:unnamed protein product [Notodromas monacha]|uniref:B30.2/SPRY domain-containing protein n=1 Tax=Notodromas monacha TaxID=399045 RepID=A0A7R9G9P5_9CRUS|nr:unnamed protein product [Notodromas monacha]CAG0912819.1 unnamed protein product [Notodromas monacha]
MEEIVRNVFGDNFVETTRTRRNSPSPIRARKSGRSLSPIAAFDTKDRSLLDRLDARIASQLDSTNKGKSEKLPVEKLGRLGPAKVHFDIATHVGSFIVGPDRVGVGSQSHFSSLKANVCVFKGKWQYEVLLGSKGVMQVGWCTKDCQFSEENGVGDTIDSYSYDGNRVRKWNVATYRYGEPWLSGDIIGVTIDCDDHKIEFYRNGRSLGVAFSNVKSAPGVAYLPGVSLGDGENLVANFGATPYKYPVKGFSPLQDPPESDLKKGKLLFGWLANLIEVFEPPSPKNGSKVVTAVQQVPSRKAKFYLVGARIFRQLSQLLVSPYIVEAQFMPFLQTTNVETCLTVMWALIEDQDLIKCMEYVCISLLTKFRQSASSGEFPNQKASLSLLKRILNHERTRKLLLKNVFFERVRFPTFMHLKPLDDDALKVVAPVVYWEGRDEKDKAVYETSIAKLGREVGELEKLQLDVLKQLLITTDGKPGEPSSRCLFLHKIRRFIKENIWSARIPLMMQTPTPVMLCFFHRLLTAHADLLKSEGTLDENVHVPLKAFCDDGMKYFDCNRLGGAYAYLRRTLRKELAEFLGPDFVPPPQPRSEHADSLHGIVAVTASVDELSRIARPHQINVDVVLAFEGDTAGESSDSTDTSTEDEDIRNASGHRGAQLIGTMRASTSEVLKEPALHELLDDVVWIFHLGAHKQIAKMTALRENLDEFLAAEKDLRKKISVLKDGGSVKEELEASSQILKEKISDEVRHMAWVSAVIYTKNRQQDLIFLTKVIMETLNRASKVGSLLAFVPDFYIDSLCECVQAIRVHMHPTVPFTDAKFHGKSLLTALGSLIAQHFADERVIFSDSKDSLIEALATFVSSEQTLRAMENMKREESEILIRMLLRPYESRPWAQTNWILVRLWKGDGFGFRYTETPNQQQQFYPKMTGEGISHTNHIKPCPSPFYQKMVAELLVKDPELCKVFLNSVLNQLNWAFSEFIGMMQEIQNAFSRPDRVFIESRQLKMCSTCFDLTLALLRVLEMCVVRCPEVFTSSKRPSADLLLSRLCQVLCQILNRVSTSVGSFNQVWSAIVIGLSIPSMEAVTHYPILAAVAGIVLGLIEPEMKEKRTKESVGELPATKALLSDPSFQMSSVAAMLGRTPPTLTPLSKLSPRSKPKHDKVFSFKECEKCVAQYLMNRRECFFCKTVISGVLDDDGKLIPDLKPPPPPPVPSPSESGAEGPVQGPQPNPNRPNAGMDPVDNIVSYTLPFRNRHR